MKNFFFFSRKFFLSIILSIATLFIFQPSPVFAHLGGGPPFLLVNGKFAQTNPYYQGQITLNIPLDLAEESVMVGKPITFAVDIPSIQKQTFMPPGFFSEVKFRWSYATGDNFGQSNGSYKYGNSATYVFSHSGSYLITLEGQGPTDQAFVIIDTAQVDVVDSPSYVLPQVSVFAGLPSVDSKPVLFVANAKLDKSISSEHYLWDFNGGKLQSGKTAQHTFAEDLKTMGIGLVYLRVVDDKGFVKDIGFTIESNNGKPDVKQFGSVTSNSDISLVKSGTYQEAQKLTQQVKASVSKSAILPWYYVVPALALILGIFIIIYFTKRGKKSQ